MDDWIFNLFIFNAPEPFPARSCEEREEADSLIYSYLKYYNSIVNQHVIHSN